MSALKVDSYPTYTLMILRCLLEVFNLGSDVLTGTIPNIYGELLNIKEIDFSDNDFEGVLSANIFEAVNIEKINLSGNYIAQIFSSTIWLSKINVSRRA